MFLFSFKSQSERIGNTLRRFFGTDVGVFNAQEISGGALQSRLGHTALRPGDDEQLYPCAVFSSGRQPLQTSTQPAAREAVSSSFGVRRTALDALPAAG